MDKLYGETFAVDRLLRLVRRHFAFGTGHLICRAIAQKFEKFAEEFRKQDTRCLEAVARNEANGQPLAAARMRREAAKQESRLPPLAERVGTNGGSRWLLELMALEKLYIKIKLVRHLLLSPA